MARAHLMGKFGVAQLQGPLPKVEAVLGEIEGQFAHAPEQPAERDPIVGREVAPELWRLVALGEAADGVADLFALHADAVELRLDVLEGPLVGGRPVHLVALGVVLAPILGDQADADHVDGIGLIDELGVDEVLHDFSWARTGAGDDRRSTLTRIGPTWPSLWRRGSTSAHSAPRMGDVNQAGSSDGSSRVLADVAARPRGYPPMGVHGSSGLTPEDDGR